MPPPAVIVEYEMRKREALLLMKLIREATEWLAGLTEPQVQGLPKPEHKSVRIFSEEECESLSLSSRRFLISLEQLDIVDAALRERIIHHILQLKAKNVELPVVEGIARIILSRQPQGAEAIKRMELLMAETDNQTVH